MSKFINLHWHRADGTPTPDWAKRLMEQAREASSRPTCQSVSGFVGLDEGAKKFTGGTLYVRLLDTTLQDAPAVAIEQIIVENVDSDAFPIYFAMAVPDLDDARCCILSAHIDVDNDGAISKGDYVSIESLPVLTQGHPSKADINVSLVD